jgi:hypothetical protein
MNRIIIYDSDHPGAVQNRCFEQEYARLGSGHSFTVELARRAGARGFKIMTSDVFLKSESSEATTAFCITDMVSRNTSRLLNRKVIPIICLSMESPIIARDFYIRIEKLAGRFVHNIQFKGTSERLLKTPTLFSVMYFPVDQRETLPYVEWRDRDFLILVNRNKRMFYSNNNTLQGAIKSILSRVKIIYQKLIDPWMNSKEIYKDRVEAIYHFSKSDRFHLYGQGWENMIPGFSLDYHHAAKKVFRGGLSFEEKLPVMSRFKFSICFENCVFPGYVTEKIFDCFLAGCIPIYYGAPDIEDFVPSDAFIDFRKFKDLEALEEYLNNFTESDAKKMLDATREFLSGKAFDKYYTLNVVDSMLNKIENFKTNLT